MQRINKLAYLSGAPRVSTRPAAAVGAARRHALGIISAFRKRGWEVHAFIAGDRLAKKWATAEYDRALGKSALFRIASDLVRIFLAAWNGSRVFFLFPGFPYCYERLAAMQSLGGCLKKRGAFWILESNAVLYKEIRQARKATFFWRWARRVEKRCYRQADLIVAVTEAGKRDIMDFAAVDAGKIVVLANAVDLDIFIAGDGDVARFFPGPTIGFVGTMYPWQGLEMLLRAVHALKREGIGYSVVLVGDGSELPELKRLAGELDLLQEVRFTGRVPADRIPDHLLGIDLGYSGQLLKRSGGMAHSPLKIFEYMAMKKPVVASAFAEAARVIHDGKNGYLFAAGDREDLERALRQAWREREKWPEIGEKGCLDVRRDHVWLNRVDVLIRELAARTQ